MTEEGCLSCIGCQTHPKEITLIDRGRPQMVQFGGTPNSCSRHLFQSDQRGDVVRALAPWSQVSCAPQVLSLR